MSTAKHTSFESILINYDGGQIAKRFTTALSALLYITEAWNYSEDAEGWRVDRLIVDDAGNILTRDLVDEK